MEGEFLERVPEILKRGTSSTETELGAAKERVAQLEKKIGQSTYEVEWLKKSTELNLQKRPLRKTSSLYLYIMRLIDEIPTVGPSWRNRIITSGLQGTIW